MPIPRRTHRIAFAGALLAGALAGAPSAQAAWTAPANLSDAGQSAYHPQVDVDDDGDFVFGWQRSDGTGKFVVQARTLSAGGTLSSVRGMSPLGFDSRLVRLDSDADGDVLFGFQKSNGTEFRARTRKLTSGSVVADGATVSDPAVDGYGPELAVNGNGDGVLLWYASDGQVTSRLYGRTRAADGTLGPIVTISDPGQDAWTAKAAIDPAGNAMLTWYRSDGSDLRVQARTLSAASVRGPVLDLSPAGENAYDSQVALDAAGNAFLTWYRYDGSDNRVQAVIVPAGGVPGSVRTLSDAGEPATSSRLALDAAGNAVIAWTRSDGTAERVQVITMSANGTLGLVRTLSDAGQPAYNPDVAVNAAGESVITWQRFDGVDSRIQATAMTATGNPGPDFTVSDALGSAIMPQVAYHDGVAMITWERPESGDMRIQYAAGP